MSEKTTLGHIDCPTCGTKGGMRITHDKNGEPFGYCEDGCMQQMRIGGKPRRVAAFVARYPWAAGKALAPVPAKPVTVPESTPAPAPAKPVTVKAKPPAPAPAPVPAKPKSANPFDYLLNQ